MGENDRQKVVAIALGERMVASTHAELLARLREADEIILEFERKLSALEPAVMAAKTWRNASPEESEDAYYELLLALDAIPADLLPGGE